MYVDDILSGGESIERAQELQRQIIAMLHSGTFQLRKWAANNPKLLENIPTEHKATHGVLHLNAKETIKTLGLSWNPATDNFEFNLNFKLPSGGATKRSILSTTARLFDPLGWVNPVIVTGEIIMQQLWSLKLGWDTPVPGDIQTPWKRFIEELPNISQIRLPRWLDTGATNPAKELHVFCDASTLAYSATAYLRARDDGGKWCTSLLLAKCKVAPIKPKITIPRAELCGALLAARLVQFLQRHLRLPIDNSRIHFWTDSMIVLGWIRGDPNRWKIFVSNRINKILEVSEEGQWRYVASEDNPADCSSRGLSSLKLARYQLWWRGPSWLSLPASEWPNHNITENVTVKSEECQAK
ncbi:PREDICTED: uncharacterized protein LOC108371266 [Rhagoletis zephyria]|uniref:uncharacterized protein LOC108371266 n=1 Tax=Rhagoletis zephyria TaxID=28612 RepID=UPI0008119E57|nr:PREDICTED: uncharacterized protein LOC108371266 [Rhagoletis zephyria]XP_036334793.1 uncharacterized protein LOC118745448 [Rhagoletis pomonella]